MEQRIFQYWTYEQDTTIFHWRNHQYLKQHLLHHLENTSIFKVPFGITQAPAYFQEWMTGVLKISHSPLLIWMTMSSSSAEWQKNTLATSKTFLKN